MTNTCSNDTTGNAVADQLIIRGAREHNLKDVSLDLPARLAHRLHRPVRAPASRSLAFDTIFAEGQRRYVESLSAYARQFLGQMDKPDVDFIEGLSPAVSIDQKSTSKNPRSTVGTITEVYDYLRLLYARAGRPHCPTCGAPDRAADARSRSSTGSSRSRRARRFQVLAPVIRGRKGEYVELFRQLQTQGFSRARVNGETHPLDEPPKLDKQKKHTIEVVVDRLAVKAVVQAPAHRLGRDRAQPGRRAGGVRLRRPATPRTRAASCGSPRRWPAPTSTPSTPTSSSRGRSRSTRRSAPARSATASAPGWRSTPSWSSPTRSATLGEGAIQPWSQAHVADYFLRLMGALGDELGFDLEHPVGGPLRQGAAGRSSTATRPRCTSSPATATAASAPTTPSSRASAPTSSAGTARPSPTPAASASRASCARCRARPASGSRLKPVSMAVTLGAATAARTSPRSARCRSTRPPTSCATSTCPPRERQIGERVLKEIQERLNFLLDVGLDYLSLDRPSGSLSGGEAQRIRLATQIGAGLVGVLYVLDEPSIGLHQRDNHRLIETLVRLKDLGNTLIVVEHDEDTIRVADWVVDIGPGAGEHGGQVVAQRHASRTCSTTPTR